MKESEMDFDAFEKLVQQKPYATLSPAEVKFVLQWVTSEQEYEYLRSSGQKLTQWFRVNQVPGPDDQLQKRLSLQVRGLDTREPFFGRTIKAGVGYSLTAIVFALAGWWLGQIGPEESTARSIQEEYVRDTVFVTTQPDTVFIEKVIYRDRPFALTVGTKKESEQDNRTATKGVSMKEKELDDLLVSGSER